MLVTVEPDKEGLAIAVSDTGIGIAPENLAKVFQPFFQVDAGLNQQFEGTGLGLALTKTMVELHEGTIGLESHPGKGTTVTIRFPRERLWLSRAGVT